METCSFWLKLKHNNENSNIADRVSRHNCDKPMIEIAYGKQCSVGTLVEFTITFKNKLTTLSKSVRGSSICYKNVKGMYKLWNLCKIDMLHIL